MTIKVRISNDEGAGGRHIRVETLNFDKLSGKTEKRLERELAPGEAATFYIHMLKDLLVSEATS